MIEIIQNYCWVLTKDGRLRKCYLLKIKGTYGGNRWVQKFLVDTMGIKIPQEEVLRYREFVLETLEYDALDNLLKEILFDQELIETLKRQINS